MQIQMPQCVNFLLEFIQNPKTLQLVGDFSCFIAIALFITFCLPPPIKNSIGSILLCLVSGIIAYIFGAYFFMPVSPDRIFKIYRYTIGPGYLLIIEIVVFLSLLSFDKRKGG